MRTLLIDDLRNLKADCIARNPQEGINLLRLCGPWDVLLLDHDMATWDENGKEWTGYDIILWLEEMVHTGRTRSSNSESLSIRQRDDLLPKHIKLVTDNASAIIKMGKALKSIRSKMERLKRKHHIYHSCGCIEYKDENMTTGICKKHIQMMDGHNNWSTSCGCESCKASRAGTLYD